VREGSLALFIGAGECRNGEGISQIEGAEISAARDHRSRDLGKNVGVSAGVTMGPTCQQRGERGWVPIRGKRSVGPWAGFGLGPKRYPAAFLPFFSSSFSFLIFNCNFCIQKPNWFKLIAKNLQNFPLPK
jgi:hypothetical protein